MSSDAMRMTVPMTVRAHERRPTTVRTHERRRPDWSAAAREQIAAKISALWRDPAYRERVSAKMREGRAQKRARLSEGARWDDPTFRAEMSARMRAGHARRKARLAEGTTR